MAVIGPLLFTVAAGFAVVIVATIVVVIGVRQEERSRTFPWRQPPTIPALLARRVLGCYIRVLPPAHSRKARDL